MYKKVSRDGDRDRDGDRHPLRPETECREGAEGSLE